VLIERRHKRYRWALILAQPGEDLEAVSTWNLDVEKDHVGLVFEDRLDSGRAVAAGGDEVNIGFAREEQFQRPSREWLVIDNDGGEAASGPHR
jgi:hypothetical protein